MKIGLKSTFTEISEFTARSRRAAAYPDEFNKTLGDLLNPAAQKDNKSNQLSPLVKQSEVRASYTPHAQSLLLPKVDPMVPLVAPPEGAESIESAPQGVKAPTGLSVRKISPDDSEWQKASYSERKEQVKAMMKNIGSEFGIDPALGVAVASIESGFDTTAVSQDGHFSKGLMQLLDGTGKELKDQIGLSENYQPHNPQQNVTLGVSYLRRLHDLFTHESNLSNNLTTSQAVNLASKEKLAVAAYNAGEGRVALAQQRALKVGKDPGNFENVEPFLPETTRNYVKKVISAKEQLSTDWS